MTRPPRPYTSTERLTTADYLEALAAELRRSDAGRTQQNLGIAAEDGYSATASGAGPGGGGGGGVAALTVVEAKADRQDPTAAASTRLLQVLRRIEVDAREAYDGLAGWRSDRPTGLCPDGHPMKASDGKRCPKCSQRKEAILVCQNPYHLNGDGQPVRLLPGERRWKSVAVDLGGIEISECAKCRTYRRRNQRSWGSATRLDVGALGVYHSDEEPWSGEVAG